jgi:outer membrane protein assembly factor BamC
MNRLARLIAGIALVNLSACSSIKEAFPDKEKDYQLSKAIPRLVIPSDLAKGGASSASVVSSSSKAPTSETATEATAESEAVAEAKPEATEERTLPPDDDKPPLDPASVTVELLASSSNINYLRLNVPFADAWRIVSKGLSRKSIEVSERNQSEKTFTVQFDPDEKPVEDGSYANEINFMLNGFQTNDKEYSLKLVETGGKTDVVILGEDKKPIADEASLKLLKVLQHSIKANLSGK